MCLLLHCGVSNQQRLNLLRLNGELMEPLIETTTGWKKQNKNDKTTRFLAVLPGGKKPDKKRQRPHAVLTCPETPCLATSLWGWRWMDKSTHYYWPSLLFTALSIDDGSNVEGRFLTFCRRKKKCNGTLPWCDLTSVTVASRHVRTQLGTLTGVMGGTPLQQLRPLDSCCGESATQRWRLPWNCS